MKENVKKEKLRRRKPFETKLCRKKHPQMNKYQGSPH